MLRLILTVALLTASTFVNAADREPGLTARLSLAHMELHKLAGLADTIKDQDDIEATGDGSRPESEVWDKEDTTRYAVEILKGARYDDNVVGRIGAIIIPAYEVDAAAKDGSMAMEMRVDGVGIKGELEYEISDFAVSGAIDVIYFETDIDAWTVTDDGLKESHATIRDFSVSPEIGVAYKINEHLSVRYAHIFDVGTKSRHGSGPVNLLTVEGNFY